ncbi:MAG: single-stranded-DNA-specific exonuclease RecJ [Planctomycetota bacterium]
MARRRGKTAAGEWDLPATPPPEAETLAREAGVTNAAAAILWGRGLRGAREACAFLAADWKGLHDPALLPGMDVALKRLREAFAKNEKVAIHGDYDVDGLAATAILSSLFRLLGRTADVHLPTRQDGYGPRPEVFRKFADEGARVIVTVDCGVTANEAIEAAVERGVDVIVTDHHEPGPTLPRAIAILNPKLEASPYPFREITGAGMAFKLAWAFLKSLSGGRPLEPAARAFLLEATALAAFGTIADVAPLIGENRILVRHGLNAFHRSERPGLRALRGFCDKRAGPPTPVDIAFRVAPRLNAAGRLGDPRIVWEMLTTDDPKVADAHAQALEDMNRERQRIEKSATDAALRMLSADASLASAEAVVLGDPAWHPGVVGIVAARIVDATGKPAIILSIEDGVARGSGRSIPGFDLHAALCECRGLFDSFGGHAQAAGVRLPADRLDALREQLSSAVRRAGAGAGPARLGIDAVIPLSSISKDLEGDLSRIAPFGEGNPEPVFAARAVEIAGTLRRMGADGSHLRLVLRQGRASVPAVAFRMGERFDEMKAAASGLDAAFKVRRNDWSKALEAELIDFRATEDKS